VPVPLPSVLQKLAKKRSGPTSCGLNRYGGTNGALSCLPIDAPSSERSSAGNAPASYGTMEKIGTVLALSFMPTQSRAHAKEAIMAPSCRWCNLDESLLQRMAFVSRLPSSTCWCRRWYVLCNPERHSMPAALTLRTGGMRCTFSTGQARHEWDRGACHDARYRRHGPVQSNAVQPVSVLRDANAVWSLPARRCLQAATPASGI